MPSIHPSFCRCYSQSLISDPIALLQGVEVDFHALYNKCRYNFIESLPKHPFIRKRLNENYFVVHEDYHRPGTYMQGPYCGARRGPLMSELELSDRTCANMLGHAVGGKSIAPGMFFCEMMIEASGGCPATLVDVEFKNMLVVPMTKTGQSPSMVRITAGETDERGQAYKVTSFPSREKRGEKCLTVEHCVGKVIRGGLPFDDEGGIGNTLVPGGYGLMSRLDNLQDIGQDGLDQLNEKHSDVLAATRERFYGTVCVEGLVSAREFSPD